MQDLAVKKKMRNDSVMSDEAEEKKEQKFDYATELVLKGKKKEKRAYDSWVKEHARKLRRLEREARGELVPGDYDGGY